MNAWVIAIIIAFIIAYCFLLWEIHSYTEQFKGGLTRDAQRHFSQTRTAYDAARFATREQIEIMRGRW